MNTSARILRGVVADLLEVHERGQDLPLALDPVGILHVRFEAVHDLRVEPRLEGCEAAENGDLDLLR